MGKVTLNRSQDSVHILNRSGLRHSVMPSTQLINLTNLLRRQLRQYALQIFVRIMPIERGRLDQAHQRRRALGSECCQARVRSTCVEIRLVMQCVWAFAFSRSPLALFARPEAPLQSPRYRYRSDHRASSPAADSTARCAWHNSSA